MVEVWPKLKRILSLLMKSEVLEAWSMLEKDSDDTVCDIKDVESPREADFTGDNQWVAAEGHKVMFVTAGVATALVSEAWEQGQGLVKGSGILFLLGILLF